MLGSLFCRFTEREKTRRLEEQTTLRGRRRGVRKLRETKKVLIIDVWRPNRRSQTEAINRIGGSNCGTDGPLLSGLW